MWKSAAAIACAVLVVLPLASCSAAAKTTCTEFGEQGPTDRSATIRTMIRERDLDPDSNVFATASVESDVKAYCGIAQWGSGEDAAATKNWDQPIENGVNWSKYEPR